MYYNPLTFFDNLFAATNTIRSVVGRGLELVKFSPRPSCEIGGDFVFHFGLFQELIIYFLLFTADRPLYLARAFY